MRERYSERRLVCVSSTTNLFLVIAAASTLVPPLRSHKNHTHYTVQSKVVRQQWMTRPSKPLKISFFCSCHILNPHPSSPPFAIPVPTRWHTKSWSTYIQTKATPKRRKSKEREPRVEWKRLRVERERKWINKWSFNTFHQIEREYRVPQF